MLSGLEGGAVVKLGLNVVHSRMLTKHILTCAFKAMLNVVGSKLIVWLFYL